MFIASNNRVLKHLKHMLLTLFPSEIGQAVTVFSVPADTQHLIIVIQNGEWANYELFCNTRWFYDENS
ncbi:hypothetical protein NC651_008526 [Populus alba x Populus x berolinensis]|nr:hypothetical protein NC651_008526 [Populus alba x Populus x berolinensis]